jgi:energy-converting hydrogenase A subunit M
MSDDLNEFKADHTDGDVIKGSEVPDPVTAEGGPVKKKLADVSKPGDQKAFSNPGALPVSEEVDAFSSLFEGTDLSEEFKQKASLVFEAAVNEAATLKANEIAEALEEKFQTELEEAVNESMGEIVENLDAYLDYVVTEWMEENAVAIESSVKVTMAESLMAGLKDLFESHNIQINEETIDVVSELEEQIEELKTEANAAINESIELKNEIAQLRAEKVFNEVTEGLTVTQVERMRVLSEKLDISDLSEFGNNLETLKESFFKSKLDTTKNLTESVDEENEIMLEETKPQRVSEFDSVNSIVSFLNSRK